MISTRSSFHSHLFLTIFFFPPFNKVFGNPHIFVFAPQNFFIGWGAANRLHCRTCYTKKEPPRRISEVLKVAATSSPTIFRNAVPSAMLSLCPVPSPLSAPLSRAPARHRRAHRRPPRASDAFFSTQRPPLTHDYIKSMVSLIRCTIVRLFY